MLATFTLRHVSEQLLSVQSSLNISSARAEQCVCSLRHLHMLIQEAKSPGRWRRCQGQMLSLTTSLLKTLTRSILPPTKSTTTRKTCLIMHSVCIHYAPCLLELSHCQAALIPTRCCCTYCIYLLHTLHVTAEGALISKETGLAVCPLHAIYIQTYLGCLHQQWYTLGNWFSGIMAALGAAGPWLI